MPAKKNVRHIALTGEKIVHDWDLIRELNSSHPVVLIKRELLASDVSLLALLNALVIDCTERCDIESQLLPALKKWKKGLPGLSVILVDGGLTQEQIAKAFRSGVKDYFAFPYDFKLLADRIKFLTKRQSSSGDLFS